MRRWLTRILICLTLGVVTTVGVAWGLALFAETMQPPSLDRTISDDVLLDTVCAQGPGVTLILWRRMPAPVIKQWRVEAELQRAVQAGVVRRGTLREILPIEMKGVRERKAAGLGDSWLCATGWPLRAFAYEVVRDDRTSTETLLHGFSIPDAGSWSTGVPGGVARALGHRPFWVGLFIDTLLYGILWFGVLFGFRDARRTLRKKRGRCPACAYPIGTSPVCTECGGELPRVKTT